MSQGLARTLTEQFGVQVICQGDNAWTDGDKIVLPSLPEPLTRRGRKASGLRPAGITRPACQGDPMAESLERMMVGFLDHEVGHVAFSDFKVAQSFAKKHPGQEGLLNVIEDARIERDAMQRWPGVRRNLDMMFEQIRPRVVRDPIRKLSDHERLIAPAKLAVEYGLPREWIVKGIVAALRYHHPDDRQSLELQEQLQRDGLRVTLRQICSIAPDSPLADEIVQAFKEHGNDE